MFQSLFFLPFERIKISVESLKSAQTGYLAYIIFLSLGNFYPRSLNIINGNLLIQEYLFIEKSVDQGFIRYRADMLWIYAENCSV